MWKQIKIKKEDNTISHLENGHLTGAAVISAIEKDLNDLPKPEMINPSPFERLKLPHEKYKFQK